MGGREILCLILEVQCWHIFAIPKPNINTKPVVQEEKHLSAKSDGNYNHGLVNSKWVDLLEAVPQVLFLQHVNSLHHDVPSESEDG